MGKKIKQLENLLRLWEDIRFLIKTMYTVEAKEKMPFAEFEIVGPSGHYAEFRQHIMQNSLSGEFDYKRFIDSEEKLASLIIRGSSVAPALFLWNRYSRRVFHLNKDIQTLLSATTLEGIRWDEIKWPFQSFLLILAEPLEDETGSKFSSILISNLHDVVKQFANAVNFNLLLLLLSDNLESYKPLDWAKISKQAKPGKWNKDKMTRKLRHMERDFFQGFILATKDKAGEVTGFVTDKISFSPPPAVKAEYETAGVSEEDLYAKYSLLEKARHLVVSTCLYLATLPPKVLADEKQLEHKEEMSPEISPAAITEAKKIFYIQCESTLTKESQATIAAINETRFRRQIRPHWRRGHWRRIPGGKKLENAPRHWIMPCLVNKEQLPPHSLPVSSRTTFE